MDRGIARVFLLTTLYRIVSRGLVFFFILSLLTLSIYLLGNFQEFFDTSQIFLLQLLEINLLFEVFLGLFYIFLVFVMKKKKQLFVKLILSFLSVVFCFFLLLTFKFLSAWFQL